VLKVPAVFDLFTLALLSGGFLLLWQNLFSLRQIASDGANQRVDVPADQNIHIAVGPEESAANEAAELASACGASDGPPGSGLLAHADPGAAIQNHYASSVSAAMAKSRKATAGV